MSGKDMRETLGFLAVVAGLAFVGLEIRQNNTLAQAAAYEAIGSRFADNWFTMALNPELAQSAAVVQSGAMTTEDVQQLSEAEKHRMVNWFVALHRQFETTWRQVELGLLDRSTLFYFGNDAPGFQGAVMDVQRLLWPDIKRWMSPDYAAYMESNLGLTP